MKGLKLGIYDLNELRTYLAETPTDSGGVTVNRGLLRHLVSVRDLVEKLHQHVKNDEHTDATGVVCQIIAHLEGETQ